MSSDSGTSNFAMRGRYQPDNAEQVITRLGFELLLRQLQAQGHRHSLSLSGLQSPVLLAILVCLSSADNGCRLVALIQFSTTTRDLPCKEGLWMPMLCHPLDRLVVIRLTADKQSGSEYLHPSQDLFGIALPSPTLYR